MYIVTYEERYQEAACDYWIPVGRIRRSKDRVEDEINFLIECEANGAVRNIRIWKGEELSYTKSVKVDVEVDIHWD